MIRPRSPKHTPPPHPMKPRQHILQRHKNSVSHMQPARNIGRWHGEYVWRILLLVLSCIHGRRLAIGIEASGLLPPIVDLLLEGGWIVGSSQSRLFIGYIVLGVFIGCRFDLIVSPIIIVRGGGFVNCGEEMPGAYTADVDPPMKTNSAKGGGYHESV